MGVPRVGSSMGSGETYRVLLLPSCSSERLKINESPGLTRALKVGATRFRSRVFSVITNHNARIFLLTV